MVNFEETETYPDGRVATVSTTKIPFRNPCGQTIGTIGISRDITERKRSEEAMQESEAEYRNLFENSVVGISQALPDGRLVRANNAYAQMYGYTNPEEMMADVPNTGFTPIRRIARRYCVS
jgi:PAS domain-containing protein